MQHDRLGLPRLAALLLAIWVFYAIVLLVPGHMAVSGIEGDVLHALDGAMRMALGAIPHLEFSTPLGAIAFGSIALPLAAGLGPGISMMLANLAMALLFLPLLLWLRATRLGGWLALILGVWVMIETVGLVHDSATPTVTFALYYNRWSWAVFTMIAVLMLFDPREGQDRPAGDGIAIGLAMAYLAMLKMTFFVALLPAVMVWVLSGRRWRCLAFMAASGLAVAAIATLWAGTLEFWRAYLADLLLVATSDTRPAPGMQISEIVGAPVNFMGTFLLLASIVALRKSGHMRQGLMLLFLLPGMTYVTYQNWANAPVWLVALLMLLIGAYLHTPDERRVFGRPARAALAALALMTLTQAAPYVGNMFASPFRHLGGGGEDYSNPIRVAGWNDLLFLTRRGAMSSARIPLGTPPEDLTDPRSKWDMTPVTFMGRTFQPCNAVAGIVSQMDARAASLANVPDLAGDAVLTVDMVNITWMFTGGKPMTGGSAWYYGGHTGFEAAKWLVVPACPMSALARATMLKEIESLGWRFEEVYSDDVVTVYRRLPDAGPEMPALSLRLATDGE